MSIFLPVDAADFGICSCFYFAPLPLRLRSHLRTLEESLLEAKVLSGLCMLFVVLKPVELLLLLHSNHQVSKMVQLSKFAIPARPKLRSKLQ